MKPTYTREQLEALRDCTPAIICDPNIHCLCPFDGEDECLAPANRDRVLAADLLSALDEIERLRTALEWYTNARGADGDYIGEMAIDALKETTDER